MKVADIAVGKKYTNGSTSGTVRQVLRFENSVTLGMRMIKEQPCVEYLVVDPGKGRGRSPQSAGEKHVMTLTAFASWANKQIS